MFLQCNYVYLYKDYNDEDIRDDSGYGWYMYDNTAPLLYIYIYTCSIVDFMYVAICLYSLVQ